MASCSAPSPVPTGHQLSAGRAHGQLQHTASRPMLLAAGLQAHRHRGQRRPSLRYVASRPRGPSAPSGRWPLGCPGSRRGHWRSLRAVTNCAGTLTVLSTATMSGGLRSRRPARLGGPARCGRPRRQRAIDLGDDGAITGGRVGTSTTLSLAPWRAAMRSSTTQGAARWRGSSWR